MKLVKFVTGERVGVRCYRDGETASIPTRNADDLIARGAAVDWPPPEVPPAFPGFAPSDEEDSEQVSIAPSAAVIDRVVKPAEAGLSKRAMKKLFGRKGV